MRYDLRPGFDDREGNISNFLRDTPNGDVVVPDAASLGLTSPGFAGSIGSSRILTADQAGLPLSLRNTDTQQHRASAWHRVAARRRHPHGASAPATASYYTRLLGAVFNSLTGIHTSDNVTFANAFNAGGRGPTASSGRTRLPAIRRRGVTRVGTQNFSTANDPELQGSAARSSGA